MALIEKEQVAVLVSKAIEVFVAFLLIRLVSEHLIPEQFALLQLFIALTQGITWVFLSPFQNFILVNSGDAFEKSWLSKAMFLMLLFSMFIAGISYYILNYVSATLNIEVLMEPFFLFIAAVIVPINLQIVGPLVNISGKRLEYAIFSVAGSLLMLAFPVYISMIYGPTFVSWQAGVIISQFITCLIFLWFLRFRVGINGSYLDSWTGPSFETALKFVLPLSIAVGFQWYISQGYRIQLEAYVGLAELGYFLMGFTFGARVFNSLEKIFSAMFMPKLYNRKGASIEAAWKSYFKKMFMVYTAALICLSFCIDILFEFLVSDLYIAGASFLLSGLVFDYIRCNLNSVFQYNMLKNKNQVQLFIYIVFSILVCGVIGIVVDANGIDFSKYFFAIAAGICFLLAAWINKKYVI